MFTGTTRSNDARSSVGVVVITFRGSLMKDEAAGGLAGFVDFFRLGHLGRRGPESVRVTTQRVDMIEERFL